MHPLARAVAASFCAVAALPAASYAGESLPELWRGYAEAAVAPNYDWHPRQASVPNVLGLLPTLPRQTAEDSGTLAVRWLDQAALVPGPQHLGGAESGVSQTLAGGAFDSQWSGSRLSLRTGAAFEFGLSAIAARQLYATRGFGYSAWDGVGATRRVGVGTDLVESAEGSGVRLDYRHAGAGQPWRWQLAVQSHIEMDAFNAYRGVYAEPGDFDVPGFVQLTLEADLAPGLELSFEAQRVYYSEVPAFAAAALPTRFLSLLGDGTSPSFAWRDLDVFALEASLGDERSGRWGLRWATQEQPRPSSAMLDRALSELYSDRNLTLSYQLALADIGEFRIGASYAPEIYFLGARQSLGRSFRSGEQLEFEANWTLAF